MGKRYGFRALLLIFSFTGVMACQSTYYAVWEKLGKEKRHLLRDHVEKARSEQERASEEFKDVLTRVKALYGFKGGDLEAFYEKLKDDYDAVEARSRRIEDRMAQVEEIAEDLFEEWEAEIDEMTNPTFKTRSRQSLEETRARYGRLHKAMTQARSRMEPVLRHLKDYVLYLKHNLNAQAIGALKQEVADIELEVNRLIADIGKSITEADAFLKTLE
jgi:hypothetical protein